LTNPTLLDLPDPLKPTLTPPIARFDPQTRVKRLDHNSFTSSADPLKTMFAPRSGDGRTGMVILADDNESPAHAQRAADAVAAVRLGSAPGGGGGGGKASGGAGGTGRLASGRVRMEQDDDDDDDVPAPPPETIKVPVTS
jgi:hypothetical protein